MTIKQAGVIKEDRGYKEGCATLKTGFCSMLFLLLGIGALLGNVLLCLIVQRKTVLLIFLSLRICTCWIESYEEEDRQT